MAKHKQHRQAATPPAPPPEVAEAAPAAVTPEEAVAASTPPAAPGLDATPGCGNCRHWQGRYDFNHPNVGECRRYPPTVMTQDLTLHGPRHTFPITHKYDSCGEHSPA